MNHNPYTAPAAPLVETAPAKITLYSPNQAACGTLLGGPVGLIYFLRQNFVALGNKTAARNCLLYGALLILLLVMVLAWLPTRVPTTPVGIVYIVLARIIAEKYQATKETIAGSDQYAFRSNWNVFGMGLLCFVGSAILVMGLMMLFRATGMVA